jgi:hypothetical protein
VAVYSDFQKAIRIGVNRMSHHSFVSFGRAQLIAAYEARVRASVEANHASEFADAGFLRRLLLRHRIEREIQQELDRIAPRKALY